MPWFMRFDVKPVYMVFFNGKFIVETGFPSSTWGFPCQYNSNKQSFIRPFKTEAL
jgi:hypothetical protein